MLHKKSEEIHTDNAKYIRHRSGIYKWRANPCDEKIYVSFSLADVDVAYKDEKAWKMVKDKEDIKLLPKDAIKKYKELLQNEWIDRAQLPIALLPENLSKQEIRNKNVVFILSDENGLKNKIKHHFGGSYPINYLEGKKFEEAQYKIIILTPKILSELTNADLYAFLHETGHAIVELKHPQNYHDSDIPPFYPFDCSDTVMVYYQDCSAVVNEMAKIYYAGINQAVPAQIDTSEIKTAETVNKTKSYFPIQLGKVDLEAAQDFKHEFKQKNENKGSCIIDSGGSSSSPVILLSELIETCLKKPCNYLLDTFTDYVIDVVNTCPGYFNTYQSYQGQNYGLMFSPMVANNMTLLPLAPSSCLQLNNSKP